MWRCLARDWCDLEELVREHGRAQAIRLGGECVEGGGAADDDDAQAASVAAARQRAHFEREDVVDVCAHYVEHSLLLKVVSSEKRLVGEPKRYADDDAFESKSRL